MLNSSDGGHVLAALSSIHCPNITKLLENYLSSISAEGNLTSGNKTISDNTTTIENASKLAEEISQRNAVIYIVVVLFFYSFGIGIMMIKYMRKEAKEQEEFKMYRRYMNDAHDNYVNSTNRARLANRLALQALNMVNAIPQTSQVGSKVTFV
ncbi:uncharacterized protein LOC129217341 [Uloborus diversus]|uniref:uncharacterized protein LOC129217341 n=1 Tax=Uloborus diversus TaxID=327109 RepID=UPI00240A3ED3|nr:uncharacterized protein LOC129217341 [Uloborus diversus]